MTRSLRKKHLQVWSLLAVLLPIGIIAAYRAVPQPAIENLLQPGKFQALPIVLRVSDKENYNVSIRSNQQRSKFQLEWINKKAGQSPSSLIYKIGASQKELIGRIDPQGTYYFSLDADTNFSSLKFVLHDIVHQQTTDTINFQP